MEDQLLEPIDYEATITHCEQTAVNAFTSLKTSDASEVVQALQNREIMTVAVNDDEVKDKLNVNAKGIIETHSDTIAQDTKLKHQNASFRVNEFACSIYGVDKSCPIWQQRLMKIGAAFWFLIYWLFASITIVPVNVFLQMIGNIVKNGFFKWMLTIVFYIALLFTVIGTPILINFLREI